MSFFSHRGAMKVCSSRDLSCTSAWKNVLIVLIAVFYLSACQGGSESTNDTDSVAEPDDVITLDIADDALTPFELACADTSDVSRCVIHTAELLDTVATHHYRSKESIKVNRGHPYESDIASGKFIDVYINKGHEAYLNIDPGIDSSGIELDEGATIIREVWSAQSELESYTAMVKMESGYFPEGGDFMYALLNPDGSFLEGGRLDTCAACHLSRERDGFLFGVIDEQKQENIDQQDTDAKLAQLARKVVSEKQYLDISAYFPINSAPYPSELNSENMLKVYISQFAALNYLVVHRDGEGSYARVPEETVIIRQVENTAGDVKNITVMIKGAIGYYPEGGDFFYGVYDIDGNPIVENGDVLEGRLDECGDCHRALRANDGFLFGVSSENRG